MTIDKAKLKVLAEAATQGEWIAEGGDLFFREDGYTKHLMETSEGSDIFNDAEHPANISFIAAASPATVLALLAEVEGLHAQHGRDSAELRCLCQARDDLKWELRRLQGELDSVLKNYRSLSASAVNLNSAATSAGDEISRLKAENGALRKALGEISGQVDGNIRCVVRDVVNCRGDVQDIYGYCDAIDGIIDAAMAKETSHG